MLNALFLISVNMNMDTVKGLEKHAHIHTLICIIVLVTKKAHNKSLQSDPECNSHSGPLSFDVIPCILEIMTISMCH